MNADIQVPSSHRYLSADGLIQVLRRRFDDVKDCRRAASVTFPMTDTLMAAFAMFSLKDSSLLAFQDRLNDATVKNLYRIQSIPSDTQMREILDPTAVDQLNEAFADIFHELQRGGALKQYVLLDGHYLVAIEPIVKQDGETKNDCERNATRRFLKRIKQQHPQLKLIITEDGISSNAPHIADLQAYGYHYILGAKPSDHAHLYDAVIEAGDNDRLHSFTTKHLDAKGSSSGTQWAKRLPLNASHPDLPVNYIDHAEFSRDGSVTKRFSWVTDLAVTREVASLLVRAGRCRWRIENETFNTLKNQGYHFEHNYGHGKQNLCTAEPTKPPWPGIAGGLPVLGVVKETISWRVLAGEIRGDVGIHADR